MIKRLLLPLWILAAGVLTLYSFTQVSLSLTLTRATFWQDIQLFFQHIGYFNRPLSALLYVLIVALLFFLYILTLRLIRSKKLSVKNFVYILIPVCVILFFSYNAFSHDIFNYIFDAKIVTEYGDNPYEKKALDYPDDPMLSFMQWTHRTYPYGPVWLVLSLPLSYIGMQYFLPTFFLFKLLALVAYVGTTWCIYKIVTQRKKESALFAAAFFALNPLMLIEFLVSGHNDISMMFLAVFSILLFISGKKLLSLPIFALSVGVKFATGFLLPMFLYWLVNPKKWERGIFIGTLFMIAAVIAASLSSGNFQPWYLSFVFVIVSLLSYKKYVYVPFIVITFLVAFHYVPYLYLGNWDSPVPEILQTGLFIAVTLSVVSFIYFFTRSFSKRSKV